MKKALAIIIGLSIVCVTQTRLSATMTDVSVPQDITQFYSDWNFAACFSTPSERSRLRLIDDIEQEKDLSQRLRRVGKCLNGIESRIKKTDPGMVILGGLGDSVTAAFTEPIDTVKEGDAILIRVRVWPLSPVDNPVFVSFYEKSHEKTPVPDIQQLKRLSRGAPRTEIHKWSIVNGRWMQNEVNIVLIQD